MTSLVVVAPDGSRRTVDLGARPLKFGRADTCDVVLRDDAEISREHAEIWEDEQGRIVVADNGSKNGTRVDEGEAFRATKRFASLTVRIGEHDIHILGSPRPVRSPSGKVIFAADQPGSGADTQVFASTRGLDLNEQRLGLVLKLTQRIGGVFDRKQLLEQALDACCEALSFERGLIVLKTQRGDTEHPVTRNIQTDEHGAYKVSRTLINRALLHGERAIVNNPATDLAGNLSDSLVRFPICSALCVPILYQNEVLGVIYGDRITVATTYEPADVDFLAGIAQQVGVGLANLRLLQEHVKTQAIMAELNQARMIQQRLLPHAPLSTGRVAVEGINEPSSAVGGDYFDYFEIDSDCLGLVIADVTGHGLAAALLMANLQSALRVALAGDAPLPTLMQRVNRLICRNTAAHVFITAIVGRFCTRTGVLEYVSAGHPGPLMVGPTGVQVHEPAGSLPLGIEPDETFAVSRLQPRGAHESLLFYTDGLTEAFDAKGEMLGLPPVVQALADCKLATPTALIRAARATVRQFTGDAARTDDMTLLATQLRPS